jgi:hypothetical protein
VDGSAPVRKKNGDRSITFIERNRKLRVRACSAC